MDHVSSRTKLLVELCLAEHDSDPVKSQTRERPKPNHNVGLIDEDKFADSCNSIVSTTVHIDNDINDVYVLDDINGTLRPITSDDIGDNSDLGIILQNDEIESIGLGDATEVVIGNPSIEQEIENNFDFDFDIKETHEQEFEIPSNTATILDGLSDEDVIPEATNNDSDARPVIEEEPMPLLTKSGNPRKRKKYDTSVAQRKALKKARKHEAHSVKPPCTDTCKLNCFSRILEDRQKEINCEYWAIDRVEEKKSFIIGSISREPVKRKTSGDSSRRTWTNRYYLKTEEGSRLQVCKIFFLATLGYDKTNDKIIQNLSKQTSKVSPLPDRRKGRAPPNKVNNEIIIKHIEAFEPSISHYRREHAPNRRYLPSDLSITQMFQDFKKKHPQIKCSYDLYRREVADRKISFVKLGHEQCETCENFNLHGHKKDNLQIEECEVCKRWNTHKENAAEARKEYQKDADEEPADHKVTYSVDMEKVIMLPRCEMFKSVIFTTRLSAYNESFAPVGKKSKQPIVACLWHDGIRGRNKEELVSTFYKFFSSTCRDTQHIVLWMDNCSAQNKNWTLFTFLVFCVNATEFLSVETLDIKYFEPGHTFMSCDSFHHLVEKSLHRQKVYDFEDFKTAVNASSSRVNTLEMRPNDFYKWEDCSKKQKVRLNYKTRKDTPTVDPNNAKESTNSVVEPEEEYIPYLKDIVQVQAKRGSNILYYKTKFEDQTWKELDFLNKSSLKKGIRLPSNYETPKGISRVRKEAIIKNLLESEKGIVPESRFAFWKQLPTCNEDTSESSRDSNKKKRRPSKN